jgi:hypothetical protein
MALLEASTAIEERHVTNHDSARRVDELLGGGFGTSPPRAHDRQEEIRTVTGTENAAITD